MNIGRTYRIHFNTNQTSDYDFLGTCVTVLPPTFVNVNHMNRHNKRTITKGPLLFIPELFTFYESGETLLVRKILNGIIPCLGDEYTKPN
jgi:hypothetical protein